VFDGKKEGEYAPEDTHALLITTALQNLKAKRLFKNTAANIILQEQGCCTGITAKILLKQCLI
jgi:hypothetical protein